MAAFLKALHILAFVATILYCAPIVIIILCMVATLFGANPDTLEPVATIAAKYSFLSLFMEIK